MIQRTIAITIVLLLALTTSCDARLQGLRGSSSSSSSSGSSGSSKESSKDRKITEQEKEKEEDELLLRIDEEYSMNNAEQKAYQDNDKRVLPTHLLLGEVKAFEKNPLDEEIMIAKALLLEKEQQSANDNDNDNEIIKVNELSAAAAAAAAASSSITRMKSVVEYVDKEVTDTEHEIYKLYIAKDEEKNKITNGNKGEEKTLLFGLLEIEEEEKELQQQAYLEEQTLTQTQIDDKYEQLIKQTRIAITMSSLY
ncbi:hypothetical protein FRACYDRAFT_267533 [Fragilariopsis cylindrus CCMP1102]|uniref:Uncharacterized protein n=1 Tax=Fragilariopsis cylindrus CCMP1102 TaxID=635003 RepID=A0A1E7FZ45_9STRA|nr:hypothetical protein FRACYDRAFT_267533 [Fragilariopsis cylindrus CCMP1102]|eukprot:OEU23432.1 hypothetical protein FRACYDRAFT_267533 [Fragilariopsis cylindrus CCMP1102]